MAISDRITSIEEHIKESYQELEGIGIDTTGVNKNLENIPKLIDGYWETLPKVTGKGTSITLDNTKEGKMKVLLKGNTYQDSTSGINLFCPDAPSKTQNGLTVTNNGDGTFTISGTATNNVAISLTTGSRGKELTGNQAYTLAVDIISNGGSRGSITCEIDKNGTTQYNFFSIAPEQATGMKVQVATPSEDATIKDIAYYVANGLVVNNLKIRPYLVKGSYTTSTIPPYEPYTNGASPNPDYPQDIHVVSGDNTIVSTGKNLFGLKQWLDKTGATYTENSDGSITFTTISALYNTIYPIKTTDRCVFSYKITNGTGTNFRFLYVYEDGTSTQTTGSGSGTSETSVATSSSVPTAHGKVIGIKGNWTIAGTFTIKECMLEQLIENVSPQPYEPYQSSSYPISLGDIELCKIGTYQDRFIRNSGKNLFDDSQNNNNWIAVNGNIISVDGSNMKMFNCKENETFTLSANYVSSNEENIIVMAFYNSGETLLNRYVANIDAQLTITATSPVNTSYIKVAHYSKKPFTIQLEKGSTSTAYEPYGNGDWYLNKQIGKHTIQTGDISTISSYWLDTYGVYGASIQKSVLGLPNTTNNRDSLCNISKKISALVNIAENTYIFNANIGYVYFFNSTFDTIANAEAKLVGANVYYNVDTPTYTKIEGTLKDQLNALAKSYASQTNISQENNDLASILNATALEEME